MPASSAGDARILSANFVSPSLGDPRGHATLHLSSRSCEGERVWVSGEGEAVGGGDRGSGVGSPAEDGGPIDRKQGSERVRTGREAREELESVCRAKAEGEQSTDSRTPTLEQRRAIPL